MQTITTKYYGATNTKPSKIVATTSGSGTKVSMSFGAAEDAATARGCSTGFTYTDAAHDSVALALCVKLGWLNHPLMRGNTKTGCVYVFDSHANRVRHAESDIVMWRMKGPANRAARNA